MRLKPVPEPPDDLAVVAAARRAVPMVPGSEADCCARLQDRLDAVGSRDEARAWLTFLRALGLVAETASGSFVRTDAPVERDALADAFRERVFGAREVLAALDEAGGGTGEGGEPVSVDDAFAAFEGTVPRWERDRDPGGWRDRWRERVARLLGWAALLGLAERVDGGYRSIE